MILPEGVKILQLQSGKVFVQIEPKLGMTYADGKIACDSIGGTLADLYDDADLRTLSTKIDTPHWIKSFNGRTFDEQFPPALYAGPAIAHPKGLSNSLQGVLCQVY